MFMNKKLLATAAIAAAMISGSAQAATSTGNGSVTLTVVTPNCTVTGAAVDFGTYNTSQTWGAIGAVIGVVNDPAGGDIVGQEYDIGSVTCTNGTPWTLITAGSAAFQGRIQLDHNGKRGVLWQHLSKVAGAAPTVATGSTAHGNPIDGAFTAGATGTGSAQALKGRFPLDLSSNAAAVASGVPIPALTDVLGVTGTVSDTVLYTLTF